MLGSSSSSNHEKNKASTGCGVSGLWHEACLNRAGRVSASLTLVCDPITLYTDASGRISNGRSAACG
jgi:hypothetical protein